MDKKTIEKDSSITKYIISKWENDLQYHREKSGLGGYEYVKGRTCKAARAAMFGHGVPREMFPPCISEDEIMKAVECCVQNQKDELMKILDAEE